jgi:aspartyl-tRNA(Asn)/glutamyl-tRNA(Gln) amidotransferase subunit C
MASVELNEALTRQVAQLARLELTDAEVRTFTAQMGNVLRYINLLQEVDVKGVEPMTHSLDLSLILREDVARPSPRDPSGAPKVFASAPEVQDDGFKVPPIL